MKTIRQIADEIVDIQKQQLIAKSKEQERKARTHRLIRIGGAVESVLGRTTHKTDYFFEAARNKRKIF